MKYIWVLYSKNDVIRGYVNTYKEAELLVNAKGWYAQRLSMLNAYYPNAN